MSEKRAVKNKRILIFLFVLSQQSSVKFDLTGQPLSELDSIEELNLDGQLPGSLLAVSNLKILILSL